MIASFSGQYSFLSNMYECTISLDGIEFPSAEHAFQFYKCTDPQEGGRILSARTPYEARRRGRRIRLIRSDWETARISVMHRVVCAKFAQNPDLQNRLVSTFPEVLVEGNTWHDTFWGVDLYTSCGENHLGTILMEIRSSYL